MRRATGFVVLASTSAVLLELAAVQSRGQERIAILQPVEGTRLGVVLVHEGRGALVKEVRKQSPAEKAGLEEGDVIVRFRGEAVHTAAQLARMVRETPAGRTVALDVNRKGSLQQLSATLDAHADEEVPTPPIDPDAVAPPIPVPVEGEAPVDSAMRDRLREFRPRRLGMSYQEISRQLAQQLKLGDARGILVTHVDDAGPAARAGLKAGDVILSLDGKDIGGPGDFRRSVARVEPGAALTLTVQREGRLMDLKLTPGETPALRRPNQTPTS